jgi:lysophospholipase L1-like esterase
LYSYPSYPMKTLLALLALPFLLPGFARADFLVQPNDVVGIGGDSITQQHLYSAFMEDYLLMCQPTAGQKIVNFGWGGETAPGFLNRLGTDVYPFKPTVVTTCYGMNDGGYRPISDDISNPYKAAQTGIVDALKKNGVRVVIIGSPKCVDTHYFHNPNATPDIYNKNLGTLSDIDKQIAQQEGIPYADVFDLTMDVMQKSKAKFGDDYVFAGGDGVHPDQNGHLVMAYAFLKALGCDGNVGTITVDMGAKSATGTPGHEIVSDTDGLVTVKSTRYPFCFHGAMDSKSPGDTAPITQFFPFNDDLNRFMLVVKGLTGSKAKVTWGGTAKEYTADQLAKGINLAAEFYQNPFCDQFNKVNDAVQHQEQQETEVYQTLLHNLPDLKTNMAPGVDAAWQQVVDAAMAQHDKMYQAAVDLVVPITHTIKIDPEP